jgi:hypothetical protein
MRNKCFFKILNLDNFGQQKKINSINMELIINAYLKKGSAIVKDTTFDHHLICAVGNEDGSIQVVNMT